MAKTRMDSNRRRPVYLNLFQIRLPVGGVLSILHRITGFLLVLLLPLGLYILDRSLRDPQAFAQISAAFARPVGRIALLIMVWLLVQHFLSGIRHLLMDIGIGESHAAARRSAWLAFIISGVIVLLTGVCLWSA